MTKIQTAVTAAAEQKSVQAEAKKSVSALLNSFLDGEGLRRRFDELLGKRSAQFVSSIVTLVNGDVALQKAFFESPMSVISACLRAASYDLPIDPGLGYAYVMPFNNNKKKEDGTWETRHEATFVIGWKGMHQLAMRTGAYKCINVVDVREGELVSFDRLTEEIKLQFVEDDEEREKLPIIGYVGYFRLVNGAEKTIYKTVKQIAAHEERFRKGGKQTKAWREDRESMERKTVYRELIGKWGVMSIEYQNRESQMLADQMRDEVLHEGADQPPVLDVTDGSNGSVDELTGEVIENEAVQPSDASAE